MVALMFVNVATTRKASEICQFIIYKVKHKLDVVVIQSEEFKTCKKVKCFVNKKKQTGKKEKDFYPIILFFLLKLVYSCKMKIIYKTLRSTTQFLQETWEHEVELNSCALNFLIIYHTHSSLSFTRTLCFLCGPMK